jgi:hypothetical protein
MEVAVGQDATSLRNFLVNQQDLRTTGLLKTMLEVFLSDPDTGLRVQMAEILKLILDTGPEVISKQSPLPS